MLIKRCTGSHEELPKVGALLLLLTEEDCGALPDLHGLDGIVKELISRRDFTGKKGSLLRVPIFNSDISNLYLAGLGKKDKSDINLIRNTIAWSLRTIGRQHNNSAAVPLGHLLWVKHDELNFVLDEAAGLCGYVFDKYRTKKENEYEPFSLSEIFVSGTGSDSVSAGEKLASAQIYSRELANEPGCVISPAALAQRAEELTSEFNGKIKCEVWDEERLRAERMGALLAVGSGSENPPRLIHLTYSPGHTDTGVADNIKKKIVFVGKGITFDSGGLNIKPDSYMLTMKGDKTGACNVLGILRGAASLELNVEVHGIIAAAENMPSGSSYRPDDIVRARNGKTIEINNTDAEGRLVLADALCLASELKPDAIIDMATLTGACAVALGKWRAGLFSNDEELASSILKSSEGRGEPLWRMPLEDEHISESLKSPFADLINSGPRYGGAIFAALFLSQFVEDGISWAHLDIAGVDFLDKEWGIYSKGASAFGVRTCLDYLMNIQGQNS